MSEQVVIVGAGHAAGELVAQLVEKGFSGDVTLIGEEPFLPYQRPPLSKVYLTGAEPRDRLFLRLEDFYAEHGVTVMAGTRAESIDRGLRDVVLSNGERVRYDALVLATGARVRDIACDGTELPGVHYLRTIDDADRLRARLTEGARIVVIGGGYIGLEVAASARTSGCEVTVLEREPRLLARVATPEFASEIDALHKSRGVAIHTSANVSHFAGEDRVAPVARVESVLLEDGTAITADTVVVGIGVIANTELAEAAGLATANGISVDAYCRTDDPAIYAMGDVASFPFANLGHVRLESVQNAVEQAHAVAANLLGAETAYAPVPWFWSDQFDAHIQIAGLSTGYDKVVRRAGTREGAVSFWLYRGDQLAAVEALSEPRAYMIGKRCLEQGVTPDPASVADATVNLKALIR